MLDLRKRIGMTYRMRSGLSQVVVRRGSLDMSEKVDQTLSKARRKGADCLSGRKHLWGVASRNSPDFLRLHDLFFPLLLVSHPLHHILAHLLVACGTIH